jgi:hypothetical protein
MLRAVDPPIFTKTYDLLAWLLPAVARFPRPLRPSLGHQIEDAAFGFHHAVLRARRESRPELAAADVELAALRIYLRLAFDLRCVSLAQYEHAARMVDELGRLIGGWKRKVDVASHSGNDGPLGRDVGTGSRAARGVLEQHHDQPADGEPEQQHAGQSEQQHRVPVRE